MDNEVLQENHYYPFGLNHDGPFYPQQPVTNQYQYNGKELNEEFGLGWNDYGARFYDAAVGRFTTVDPLAEDYNFQTPYAYAINNPILFIDFLGLGPIFGPDGKIIGWEVEEGEGPTQIAEKLNTFYSCELTCEVGWTEIVYNNAKQFQNVFDGNGEIEDEYNGDYKSGNISPGDELVITNGKENEENIEDERISEIDRIIDSLKEENRKLDSIDTDATLDNYRDISGDGSWGEGGNGAAYGRGVLKGFTIGGKKGGNVKAIKSLEEKKKNINKNNSEND